MDGFNTNAVQIAKKLIEARFPTYYVGGAVRDMARGIPATDTDLATKATPEQVQALFQGHRVDSVGKSFLVTIVDGIEVATFRTDQHSEQNQTKSPWTVTPAGTIQEDLARRDFTVNAIAVDAATGQILDPFGGMKDLNQGLIRFVGDPTERIQEDPVRVLRGIRFMVALNGKIEQHSYDAMAANSYLIKSRVPMERISIEIMKTLKYYKASYFFRYLHSFGLLEWIFHSLEGTFDVDGGEYHNETIFEHCMITGDHVNPRFPLLKLAAYLHDVGKPCCKKQIDDKETFSGHDEMGAILVRDELNMLKFPHFDILQIVGIIRLHMRNIKYIIETEDPGRSIRKLGRDLSKYDLNFNDWLRLKIADRAGNLKLKHFDFKTVRIIANRIIKAYIDLEQGSNFKLKHIAVNGNDVMQALKIGPSKKVGEVLMWSYNQVLTDPTLNRKDILIPMLINQFS